MKDTILRSDFGEDMKERELSFPALAAYPFIERAADNFGCVKDNRPIIRSHAFPARAHPTELQVSRIIDEYIKSGTVQKKGGWLFLTRWIKDNRIRAKLKPKGPLPPYLDKYMTEDEWYGDEVMPRIEKLAKACREMFDFSLQVDWGGVKSHQRSLVLNGAAPRSPGLSKESKVKEKKVKEKKESLKGADNWPKNEFKSQFKHYWGHSPSPGQINRGEAMFREYGEEKLFEAMKRVGGDYGFRSVMDVLTGKWDEPRGSKGKDDRHDVDIR